MKHKSDAGGLSRVQPADILDFPVAGRVHLHEAARALNQGNLQAAERAITVCLAYAPEHAEPHRLLGLTLQRLGRPAEAVQSFRTARAGRPQDPDLLIRLSEAQADAHDLSGAIDTLRELVTQRGSANDMYLLGAMLDRHGQLDQALPVLQRALSLDADHARARALYARESFHCGDMDRAREQFRHLLRSGQEIASAWHGLAELKTIKFAPNDVDALKALSAQPRFSSLERASLLHTLGQAFEDNGDYRAAFDAFGQAARLERAKFPWHADRFEEYANSVRAAWQQPAPTSSGAPGHEVIFIVGLPRSGSTLIEQILAAHPQVEGASELPDLNAVIQDESTRRRAPFLQWANLATSGDWNRLGQDYLARTARWRRNKPHFTDKFPGNWLLGEAALAMLPGARIIDSRRDALENTWSCFKQFFAPGLVPWSRDYTDLAQYWLAYRRHADHLLMRYPSAYRVQEYERLVDDPEGQSRELLSFVGLDFDPACLLFYASSRAIRTASSAQVRQPIRRSASSSERYGALLDPLRACLATAQAQLKAAPAPT
jgi:tetratricopeptide (TPR) repeat protein